MAAYFTFGYALTYLATTSFVGTAAFTYATTTAYIGAGAAAGFVGVMLSLPSFVRLVLLSRGADCLVQIHHESASD